MNAVPDPRPDHGSSPSSSGVPLLDLGRQYRTIQQEMTDSLAAVCGSGQFVLGPEVTRLERDIASYCGTKHAIGCASGSDALLLALMALDVGPGDEVILPSFTFFATASAVTRLHARPVFADIDAETYNIDPLIVRRLVNRNTKAIIPVHLFGQCAAMNAICRIGRSDSVAIIEDAAQSIGAEFDGQRAGSIGDLGCLSFYPTKNLGGAGDGGMLTTSSDALAERLRLLRGHGMQPRYYHRVVGINSRLDSFQAAVLNVKLPHLDRWTEMRQANAQRYHELFTTARLDRAVQLPVCSPQRRHVWNQYVIRVPDGNRDQLRQWLGEAKIGSEIYYPIGLHQQECFRWLQYAPGDLPHTECAAREVLALPIFPELTAEEQRLVVDRIAAFYGAGRGGHPLAAPKFLTHPAVGSRAKAAD
jgi:dTDP-4-amino-4,6-dideoxygalactose transaminase